jgi:hypothetical protein
MRHFFTGVKLKTGFFLIAFIFPAALFCQSGPGRVLSIETNTGIGFVNIGVIERNTGTVSDKDGNFKIDLSKANDNDSLRFSMIGFESKTISVKQYREDSEKIFYLNPKSYNLPEIKIAYHKTQILMLGNPVETDELRSGFSNNDLGSEMGVRVHARKPVMLKNLNLNVAVCSFDSVTYRLNIYLIEDQIVCNNILTRPIYISFSGKKIEDVVTFDLREYSIIVEGDVLISLELYKDLGEGKLLFRTEYFTGLTYHRKTSQGGWSKAPGVIGMYLNGQVLN